MKRRGVRTCTVSGISSFASLGDVDFVHGKRSLRHDLIRTLKIGQRGLLLGFDRGSG